MTQSDELNQYVKTYLAPSTIHGIGVFALRDIAQGQKLYVDMIPKIYTLSYSKFKGNIFPWVEKELLKHWPQIINGSHFAYPVTRIQAYINHSDDPNYNAIDDILIRDVKEGEEITEDYQKIVNADKVFDFLDMVQLKE